VSKVPCILRIDGAKVFRGAEVFVDRTGPDAGCYLLVFSPRARHRVTTITNRASAKVFASHEEAKVMASMLPAFACTILPKDAAL
jgi:hypothetical protein